MRAWPKNLLENRLLQEVLIFGILFVLLTLNTWTSVGSFEDATKSVIYFSVFYIHAQIHRFILLPMLDRRKNYVIYSCITLILILAFSWLLYVTNDYWFNKKYGPLLGNPLLIYFFLAGTCTLSLIAMLVPFLLLKHFNRQRKLYSVQLALHKVELKMLRSQLNPHFLFNAFNNIYGLSLKEQQKVPGLIAHVSKLMGYIIENSNKDWIPLEGELEFIESYIALEEERLGKRCDIRYEYENTDAGTHYFIAPLILVSFIENAFKHGTHSLANSFVHISVAVKRKSFLIKVVNSTAPDNVTQPGNGIGINNTRQILDMIYPDKYLLTTAKDEGKYTVCLTLPLILQKNAEQDKMHGG
ncbi:MAG TPA: histidine kinase [Chitinophagaceae bacterium]|nr:histidine kinase [Chitinophagaceae bacterium]